MNVPSQKHQDSLDYQQALLAEQSISHKQEKSVARGSQSWQNNNSLGHMMKNMYKQDLDDLVRQKNAKRNEERERDEREKDEYNERMQYGQEAERLKQMSYKNYYQMLLNNQNTISKSYVNPFEQTDLRKEQLISQGLEIHHQRDQIQFINQQKKHQNIKLSYQQQLAFQIHQNQIKASQEQAEKAKRQEEIRRAGISPNQIDKYERERKLMEMNKYKQDLDKTRSKSIVGSGYGGSNDFNVYAVNGRHDMLVNPIPFNIQNPYLLQQFKSKMGREDYNHNYH